MRITAVTAVAIGICAGAWAAQAPPAGVDPRPPNATGQTPAFPEQTRAPEAKKNVAFEVVTVAEGLDKPWGLTFLPGGKMLVTEKPGRLRVVTADGKLSEPVAGLPPVDARNQGGLLDVALDPRFTSNQLIYWSYAEPAAEEGANNTAVARGKFVDGAAPRVDEVKVIYHQAPSLKSTLHYGGRLVFGRDGTLFVTCRASARSHAGAHAGAEMDSLPARSSESTATARSRRTTCLVRQGRRASRDLVVRPPERAGGDAESRDRRTVGGRARHARRRRDQHLAQGQGLRLADDRVRDRIPGRSDHGGITAAKGWRKPIYYWDPVIAPSGMVFTGNLFPAERQPFCRRTRLDESRPARRGGGEDSRRGAPPQGLQLERGAYPTRQGPDGAIYLLTDNTAGRILKIVPKKWQRS